MNIVLCGMMGVGKSSVGKKLQFLAKQNLVDTDSIITEKYGKISEIFSQHGEEYFRDLETQVCKELADKNNLIISTGGGLVLREENVQLLKQNGKIFYLRATLESILKRVQANESRPILKEGNIKEKISNMLTARSSIYESVADYTIDTDGKTIDAIAREILLWF